MKSINTKNSKTESVAFELINSSKRISWNNRRRYSTVSQFKFL